MTRRNETHDVRAAAAQAAQLVQKLTCENCTHLRALRPMCMGEASPHYRQPRESFHTQCGAYVPRGAKPAAKQEPPPASRAQIAGEVARRKPKHRFWTITGNKRERRDLLRIAAWPSVRWGSA